MLHLIEKIHIFVENNPRTHAWHTDCKITNQRVTSKEGVDYKFNKTKTIMKKTLLALTAFFAISSAVASDYRPITQDQLPSAAQSTLTVHFKNIATTFIGAEPEMVGLEYKVLLENGTEIEFDKKGLWKEIESKMGVPESVVPALINQFVAKSHKTEKIVKIDREKWGYEVKLSSGREVEFGKNLKFLKYDE